MSRYQVRFYKKVASDTGQDLDVRQASFDVDATDEKVAIELAKERFCSDRRIRRWTVNADRLEADLHTADARSDDDTSIVHEADPSQDQ